MALKSKYKTDRDDIGKQLGVTFRPNGILMDRPLRKYIEPVSSLVWDFAHVFLVNGIFQVEMTLFMLALEPLEIGWNYQINCIMSYLTFSAYAKSNSGLSGPVPITRNASVANAKVSSKCALPMSEATNLEGRQAKLSRKLEFSTKRSTKPRTLAWTFWFRLHDWLPVPAQLT